MREKGYMKSVERRRLLYFMHVPWGWIKQRPHFLAAELNKYYDITLFYQNSFKKMQLVENAVPGGMRVKKLLLFPYGRYDFVLQNNLAVRFQVKVHENDIVWITHPNMYVVIEKLIRNKNTLVVYDCMDDILEFPGVRSNPSRMENLRKRENSLVQRADVVLASSEHLREKLIQRYGEIKQITVVNNALDLGSAMSTDSPLEKNISEPVLSQFRKASRAVTYIGTISEWMDWGIVLGSLEKFSEITYFFFGAVETAMPKHDRILSFGPVEHSLVFPIMGLSDALVMPFKVNELIRSVNPVKLYEYIYSGKPAIAPRYPETERFGGYVTLYANKDEYFAFLHKVIKKEIRSTADPGERRNFVSSNTWEKRGETITGIIASALHNKL